MKLVFVDLIRLYQLELVARTLTNSRSPKGWKWASHLRVNTHIEGLLARAVAWCLHTGSWSNRSAKVLLHSSWCLVEWRQACWDIGGKYQHSYWVLCHLQQSLETCRRPKKLRVDRSRSTSTCFLQFCSSSGLWSSYRMARPGPPVPQVFFDLGQAFGEQTCRWFIVQTGSTCVHCWAFHIDDWMWIHFERTFPHCDLITTGLPVSEKHRQCWLGGKMTRLQHRASQRKPKTRFGFGIVELLWYVLVELFRFLAQLCSIQFERTVSWRIQRRCHLCFPRRFLHVSHLSTLTIWKVGAGFRLFLMPIDAWKTTKQAGKFDEAFFSEALIFRHWPNR